MERHQQAHRDAIIGMTLDGTVTSWNASAESLYGYSAREIIGRPITIVVPQDRYDELRRLGAAIKHGARIEGFRTTRLRKDGRLIEVRISVSPIFDAHGRVIGMYGITCRPTCSTCREIVGQEADRGVSPVRADPECEVVASATQLRAINAELLEQVRARERLAGRLLALHDEERRRIGQELHDTTAQNLVALDMDLARLARAVDGYEASRTIVDSRALVQKCLGQIRTISYLLHPPLLDEAGLASAIRWYASGFAKRSGIVVDVHIDPHLERLPRDAETALFRIVQECLTNVHRHAHSLRVAIRLKSRFAAVLLEVEDAGRGMGAKEAITEIGVGISGMRERLRPLGGQLIIASTARGTVARAIIPRRRIAPGAAGEAPWTCRGSGLAG